MHAVDGDVAAGLAQIVGERHLVQRVAKPVGEDQRDVAGLEGMSRAHVRFILVAFAAQDNRLFRRFSVACRI